MKPESKGKTGLGTYPDGMVELIQPALRSVRGGDDSILYDKWTVDHVFIQVPIQRLVAKWLESFKDFPPRAKPASFSVDQVVERFMPRTG